ncbi:SDR family NAD(P)-dependent oxidoreductase [Rubinisphaera margarita]|uniref:SDR family NAD(P)-dependent oxidoreductase n=1 Tax=Rubinisphaera margarita TaxID=2909586 RepID=UPI001EE7D986|nr:SDR family NAD(P)-dependent oxidoreductase [Rubinisphaera margarita]MCG6154759.1 SDR family oxidoreductase [Rubinisphaera margarita]
MTASDSPSDKAMPEERFASLDSRAAMVTGSSSGIGRAIALELAAGGADVIVHYNSNRDGAEETARQIRDCGRRAVLLQADLSNEAAAGTLVEDAFTAFPQLDIWINNAGVDLLTGEARDWPYETKLQRLFEIDVRGTVLLSKSAGKRFMESKRGTIINIGWDQAERGMEGDSGELFATAKNAIMGFSRSLALSLAPDVRVNCVAPGWIRTAWGEGAGNTWQERVLRETPLKRWGTPEDIAHCVRFLVSVEANYLTGQVFYVNGGAER